jgi:hypothetical protein
MINNVIGEFKNKSPKEFNKWNHFIQRGKEIDIPVTIQTDDIIMRGADGLPIGTTREGTTYSHYEVDNKRYVDDISSALVAPKISTGQTAIISLTAVMVHGLGHVEVYIRTGRTTENETEDDAIQYQHDVYNQGKGPAK